MKSSASELGLKAAFGINRSFEKHTSIQRFPCNSVASNFRNQVHVYRPTTVCSAGSVQYIEDITRWREYMNFMFEWQE